MITHKIIFSPDAAKALPFALSKLKFLRENAFYAVTHSYTVNGVNVRIKHLPHAGHQFVYLGGGGSKRYEFFTSDSATRSGKYCSPGYDNPPTIVGHATLSVFSPQGDRHAPIYSYSSLAGASPDPLTFNWQSRHSVGLQRFYGTKAYAVSSSGRLVYTTVSGSRRPPWSHHPEMFGAINPPNIDEDFRMDNWAGWGEHQTIYANGAAVARLQPLLPAPYWWRTGATALVKDATGKIHTFFITTDAMSNFYVFRASLGSEHTVSLEPGSEKFVLPSGYIKIPASSFLPSWVEQPSIDTMRTEQGVPFQSENPIDSYEGERFPSTSIPTSAPKPYTLSAEIPGGDVWAGGAMDDKEQSCDYLWAFNSTATEASAVVFEGKGDLFIPIRAQGVFEGFMERAQVLRWGYPDVLVPQKVGGNPFFAAHGGLKTLKVRRRAVLSVSIGITVFDDSPLGFSVSITPVSSVKNRFFTEVAYALDNADLVTKGVLKDHLLTTEIARYKEPYLPREVATLLVRNHTAGQVVSEWRMYNLSHMSAGLTSDPILTESGMRIDPFGDPPDHDYGTTYAGGGLPSTEHVDINAFLYNVFIHGPGGYKYYAEDQFLPGYPEGYYHPHYWGNQIVASDLKGLAFIIRTSQNNDTPAAATEFSGEDPRFYGGLHLYAWGALDARVSIGNAGTNMLKFDGTTMPYVEPYPDGASAEGLLNGYPCSEEYIKYNYLFDRMTSLRPTGFVEAHPEGHYSAFAQYVTPWKRYEGPELHIDTIACNTADGYIYATHKEAFNKAFSQSREYSDCILGGINAFGQMATGGIWLR